MTSCASTISYQYDLPNRRVIITDSLAGTITRTFDDLGRLISEVTPLGSMSYTYDAAGRRITSTVAGQPQASYSYDLASRLTSITKGTQSVQFSYDNANRITSTTLPNGIVATYSYDAGNRVTSITYTLGQTTVGNLTYNYDSLNRRVSVGGSLASTGLPAAITSATYDAANQVATWNGATFNYDADGNLLSDGSKSYAWDARGQLSGISGGVTASFAYDAFGRRIGKTIGASNTGFFYNGGAITQELNGSTVTANIWNGGTSYFQRTDSNGSVVPLVDALGSVLALADASGNLTTQYTYDPFGGTTASGAASANPFQYIGQENDLTGLYYFHARYYNPALHRFISEDPLGFGGGDVNLHAYALNSPSNFRDPSGKSVPLACAVGGAGNVVLNWVADKLTGRKITLANSADYFISGCKTGVIMEITGINWVIGKVFSGVAKAAGWAVGKIFNQEVEAVAEATEATANPFKILNPDFVPDAKAVLQNIVDSVNADLASNPALADTVLSEAEIDASQIAQIAPMSYGNALEALVGQTVDENFGSILLYTGRGAGPDFVGVGTAAGEYFDLTTPGAIGAHLRRVYGPWLEFVTYIRPPGFSGF